MANHILLQKIKLASSAASVTFSNIPQSGYTDLKIVVSARISAAVEQGFLICQPNSATTNLSSTILYGFGNNQGASSYSVEQSIWTYVNGSSSTSNGFSSNQIYIPNYNSTSSYKSVSIDGLNVNNATNSRQNLTAGLWSSNTAISSVKLYPTDGGFTASSFLSGSTFSLYGVAATGTSPATAPKADGGNIISTDGTYWYHAFLSSGFFTPISSLSCDVLTIAGGGGADAGGGGAGGVVYSSSNSLTATNYLVVIGAGGNRGISDNNGSQGNNSQFGSLTAAIGGGYGAGGAVGQVTGGNGGSGGGAGAAQGATTVTASGGTGSQGFNGGSISSTSRAGAGGGGAGQAGSNGSTNTGGVGGNGINTYSSWHTATNTGVSGYIAGGGAGTSTSTTTKSGGLGGGGNGGGDSGTSATSGVANTGSGGGGDRANTAGLGGSGIVIIRYAV